MLLISMKKINLLINLLELKYRFIYSCLSLCIIFSVFFEYKIELFFLLSESFLSFQKYFIYTNLLDPLIIYIKIVVLATILVFFPIGIYLYSLFFIKSLYNMYIKIYSCFFFILFIFNIGLGLLLFKFLFRFLLFFLLSFQRIKQTTFLQLQLEPTIQHYFSFSFFLLFFYFLIVFLPIIFFYLINKLKSLIFSKFIFRKYLYLLILCIFIVIAPPDFIFQLILLPIILIIIEIYIYILFFFVQYYNMYNFK